MMMESNAAIQNKATVHFFSVTPFVNKFTPPPLKKHKCQKRTNKLEVKLVKNISKTRFCDRTPPLKNTQNIKTNVFSK